MAELSRDRDYYFDDKEAPDGWQTYHLRGRGEARELFRGSPGKEKPIREAVSQDLAKADDLFRPGVLKLLEYFLQNAGRPLSKRNILDAIGILDPYLTQIRALLSDRRPWRLIQRAGKGGLIFAQEVRDKPSIYYSAYLKELGRHWKPRAMGTGALFQGGQWYFSGRTNALHHIVKWLRQTSSGGIARVVTGDPGSGKSAVLGYIVTCCDRQEIQQPELKRFLESMPEALHPEPGAIDFAIDLRGKNLADTLNALADCFRSQPHDAVADLAKRAGRTVLVFDGLEEAAEPIQIAEDLLRSLTGYSHLWLLIGCRRPELFRLGSSVSAIDLDAAEYCSKSDVLAYVERILLASSEIRLSPYRDDPDAAHQAAELVAGAANGNFLVAFTLARSLLERSDQIDLNFEALPRTPVDAFDLYLRRLGSRSGFSELRLRQAIAPLAYSGGEGLPLEVWALFTREDIYRIVEIASAFIAENQKDGHTVYRLYHASLAEALRRPERDTEVQRTLVEKLVAAVPEHDWLSAHWYTRKYLAYHAGAGEVLDTFVNDTRFLAAADPPELLRMADRVSSEEAGRRVDWYRLTADRLARTSDLSERLSYLELTAHQLGAAHLADSTRTALTRPWSVAWALWDSQAPHLTLREHAGPVNAVAIRGDVIVSGGSDGTVCLWNSRTGTQLMRPLRGHKGPIYALALAAGKVLTGGSDMTVRSWDASTGEQSEPLGTHPAPIQGIAVSAPHAVSASRDGTVILWDLRNGGERSRIQAFGEITNIAFLDPVVAVGIDTEWVLLWNCVNGGTTEFAPFAREVVKSFVIDEEGLLIGGSAGTVRRAGWDLDELIRDDLNRNRFSSVTAVAKKGDLIAAGDDDGVIQCWDWKTGKRLTELLRGHDGGITSLAISDGLLASGSVDGTVRLWDLNMLCTGGDIASPKSRWDLPDTFLVSNWSAIGVFQDVIVGATEGGQIQLCNSAATESSRKVLSDDLRFHDVEALAVDSEAVMALARTRRYLNQQTLETEGSIPCTVDGKDTNKYVWDFIFYRRDRKDGRVVIQSLELDPRPSTMAMTRDLAVMAYKDGDVCVFPIADGRLVYDACTSRMHTCGVWDLAISGRTVVCGCLDRTVLVWDIDANAPEAPLQLKDPWNKFAVGISDRLVAAGNWNGDLHIWDRRSGLTMGTINLGSAICKIAVDDSFVYLSCAKGLIRIDWHRFS